MTGGDAELLTTDQDHTDAAAAAAATACLVSIDRRLPIHAAARNTKHYYRERPAGSKRHSVISQTDTRLYS